MYVYVCVYGVCDRMYTYVHAYAGGGGGGGKCMRVY